MTAISFNPLSPDFIRNPAILERPVIEKILSHLGLDPQPPPRRRAHEAGQDFSA